MNLKLGEKEISLRLIIKVLLLVALVGFFCPFVTVSCGSEEILSVSGVEMITQSYAQELETFDVKTVPDICLAIAFGMGVFSLICSFSKDTTFNCVMSGGASAMAVLWIILSRWTILLQIKEYEGVLQLHFLWGWYAVLILYIVSVVCICRQWREITKSN